MNELIKNIGLGLFVNGSFALMNGNIAIQPIIITIGAIFIMAFSIYIDKRSKNERWNNTNNHNFSTSSLYRL